MRLNYHPNGTLAEVVDGNGHSTDYDPDDFDRLKTITHEGGTTEQFIYDAARNLTRKTTRASQHIDFAYDDRNRLRSRTSPTETATFLYDLGGRMTNAANSGATLVFGYDERDQLTSESTTIPGLATQVVSHQYEAAGNRTRLTYPDGAYVSYVYDELNRLGILRDDASVDQVTYTYDELSRVTHMLRASGVTSDFTYDRASRVKTILHDSPVAGVLESLVYNYTASGSIQDMTDYNGLHVVGYDATYQLTSVDYPAASPFSDVTYDYDDAGNRTSTATSSGTVIYAANALNQYTSVGGAAQTYDLNGNLTGDGTNTYGFDAENRMVSATTGSGAVNYQYDPLRRRTKKTVAGVTTYFLWSGGDRLQDHDNALARQRRYVPGPGFAPLQVGYGPGVAEARTDLHGDHLATPRVVSDDTGSRVWQGQFEAFGAHQVDPASTVELNVRFPGQYFDAESSLHENHFRSYAPSTGRYLTPDPLRQIGGLNLYNYARSNSLRFIDPMGLEPDEQPSAFMRSLAAIEQMVRDGVRVVVEEGTDRFQDYITRGNAGLRRLRCEFDRLRCNGDAPTDACPEGEPIGEQERFDQCWDEYYECASGQDAPDDLEVTPSESSASDVPSASGDYGRGRGRKVR